MIYFKRVQLPGNERELLEKAMRRVAIKRTRSLDLEPTTHNTGAEKLFLGFDDKNDVKFVRLRTSFEKFFPKIIISFPKEELNSAYRLRLGLFPTCFFVLFALGFLSVVIFMFIGDYDYGDIIMPVVFMSILVLLIWLELKIIDSKMKKAVARYESESNGN